MNENLNNELNTTNTENQNQSENQNENKNFYSGDVFNAYNPNQSTNSNSNSNETPDNNFTDEPLSMLEWLLTLVVGCIPCVGLIMFLIWGFGKSGNIHRRNFSRAYLILMIIGYVIGFIGMFILSAVSMFGYYYW